MNVIHRWLHWVSTGEPECSLELLEHTNRDDIAELKARMAVAEDALRARGWVTLAPAREEEIQK